MGSNSTCGGKEGSDSACHFHFTKWRGSRRPTPIGLIKHFLLILGPPSSSLFDPSCGPVCEGIRINSILFFWPILSVGSMAVRRNPRKQYFEVRTLFSREKKKERETNTGNRTGTGRDHEIMMKHKPEVNLYFTRCVGLFIRCFCEAHTATYKNFQSDS